MCYYLKLEYKMSLFTDVPVTMWTYTDGLSTYIFEQLYFHLVVKLYNLNLHVLKVICWNKYNTWHLDIWAFQSIGSYFKLGSRF